MRANKRVRWCAVCCLVLLSGCGGPSLIATPNLYTRGGPSPFAGVPESLRSNCVELIYATDRVPYAKGGRTRYSFQRSQSLALGTCTVAIGDDIGWEELVDASTRANRRRKLPLSVTRVEEIVRFPSSSVPSIVTDQGRIEDPALVHMRQDAEGQAAKLIADRLASVERKEIFLYVHGYHNTFDDAAFKMAGLWHFMGRVGVPVIYTWPAGRPGLLRGYTYDRESGEFTIFHFKQTIKALAEVPGLEKIHILAHSRGTDVTLTALRELHLEYRGSGRSVRDRLKLGTIILAAPDLDWEVSQQRITAERMQALADHYVFYLSRDDRAIGIAGWLFDSVQRLGRLSMRELSKEEKASIMASKESEFIHVNSGVDFIGHGYFINNPAVLSDLILVLRDRLAAGKENGRPLRREDGVFWVIDDSRYPYGRSKQEY